MHAPTHITPTLVTAGHSQILTYSYNSERQTVGGGTNDFKRFETIAFVRIGNKTYTIPLRPVIPTLKVGEIRIGSVRYNTLQLEGYGLLNYHMMLIVTGCNELTGIPEFRVEVLNRRAMITITGYPSPLPRNPVSVVGPAAVVTLQRLQAYPTKAKRAPLRSRGMRNIERHKGKELPKTDPAVRMEISMAGPDILQHHRIIRLLAGGAQGKVFMAEPLVTQENNPFTWFLPKGALRPGFVAIKISRRVRVSRYLQSNQQGRREIEVARKLRAAMDPEMPEKHVAFLLQDNLSSDNSRFFQSVFECHVGGSLASHMGKADVTQFSVVRAWLLGAVQGLKFMHGHGVYHCDIKPGNLLLTSNDYRHADIVICDFGLSVVFSDGEKQTTRSGTPEYQAPEVRFSQDEYDGPKADIFGLGKTFLRLVASVDGEWDYLDLDWMQRNIRRISKFVLPNFAIEHQIQYCALMDLMLTFDAELRPTASTVAEHPIFSLVDPAGEA